MWNTPMLLRRAHYLTRTAHQQDRQWRETGWTPAMAIPTGLLQTHVLSLPRYVAFLSNLELKIVQAVLSLYPALSKGRQCLGMHGRVRLSFSNEKCVVCDRSPSQVYGQTYVIGRGQFPGQPWYQLLRKDSHADSTRCAKADGIPKGELAELKDFSPQGDLYSGRNRPASLDTHT